MTDNGLLAVLEAMVECRRCGTPTAPHPTGEQLCGPCWRHIPLWDERCAQQAGHTGKQQARQRALERRHYGIRTAAGAGGQT